LQRTRVYPYPQKAHDILLQLCVIISVKSGADALEVGKSGRYGIKPGEA
jgi:hypothetical protein